MHWERELDVARRVAYRAGESSLRFYERGVTAETKSDESPVTIADREAERIIAAALSEAFPDDGIVGEEGAARPSRNGRRWIIDPIDGTRDFLRGNPFWSVLIGLEQDGRTVAGVCHLPAMKETYWASRGGGALRDGVTLRVSAVARLDQAVVCVNGLNNRASMPFAPRLLPFLDPAWSVRSFGGCLDAVMIASGRADVWIEPVAREWDLAPLQVLIEEAGGRFFNFDGGNSIYGGNCVACTPSLEPDLRRLLGL